MLALVFFAVAFAVAMPLRNYLSQRTTLAATISQEQRMRDLLSALQAQETALSDPAYVLAEAKRRLQYAKPGDTIYVVHAPPLAATKPAGVARARSTTPWYSSLWDTLSAPTVTGKPAVPSQDSAVVASTAPPKPAASPGATGSGVATGTAGR